MRFAHIVVAILVAVVGAPAFGQQQDRVDRMIADARASMMIDPVATRAKAIEAAELASAIPDVRRRRIALATTEWLRSEASSRLGETSAAEPLIAQAAAIVLNDEPNSPLAGEVLLTRGGLRNARAEVGGALTDYQQAFTIFQRNGNARSQAIALMLMAALYSDAMNYPPALRYLTQASEIYRGDPGLMVALYNNRANVLQDLKRHDEAEKQFRLALSYAEKMRSAPLIAQVYRNIARNRLKAGKVSGAELAVRKSLATSTGAEAPSWRPQLLALAAEVAYQRGRYEQAAELIDQSFAGIDLARTEISWHEPHETAYHVFWKLKRYDLAAEHLAAVKRLDDQATSLATTTSNALMAARFDFANQELRIEKLKATELRRTMAIEQARVRVQQIFFMGAAAATAIVILLLAFGLFTIRRSRNEVRAARDGLADTNVALERALAAKTEFLATTSHEIRTPLNGILGMTQVMLKDAALTDRTRDRLTVVQGAGMTMRALVDDLLDVAKMQSGKLTLEDAPFDLAATVRDAARLWQDEAQAKGLAFDLSLADCPATAIGDAARVRQIVFNLLSNAVKFTAEGRVSLAVVPNADRSKVAISVADTGIGIAAEAHAKIFESFSQADASTTRRFGGTGLGLSICRNLADAMGGAITLDSRPGEGAAFTVTLPLREPEIVASQPDGVEMQADAMLVLDRSPITRSMWKTLLTRHTGRLIFAGTAAEAIARLEEGGVARVLIDDATLCAGAAPLDDATTLADAARKAGAETTLLASAERPDRDRLAAGMTRLVIKPIAGAALVRILCQSDDPEGVSALESRAA